MVPFPSAVDDHQTMNAQFLSTQGAGWLIAQDELSPKLLANQLQTLTRDLLLQAAQKAYGLRKIDAAEKIPQACREVLQ